MKEWINVPTVRVALIQTEGIVTDGRVPALALFGVIVKRLFVRQNSTPHVYIRTFQFKCL